MSDIQRVIKYIAIAFAIYLVVMIIGGLLTFLGSMFLFFGNDKGITKEMNMLTFDNKYEIKELNIDIKAASLIIEESENFAIKTNNSYISLDQNKEILTIKEKSHRWFRDNNESKLIIYLPKSIQFDKFRIDAGAGKIEIDNIISEEINLSLGAGQVIIDNLEATKKSKISGGAGEMIIKNGLLNNLDFDMGVGHVKITSALKGDSDIDAGIGELEINILGPESDYELEVEKGIGRIEVNGKSLNNDSKYGNGINKIEIDGGVGKIDIRYQDKEPAKENTSSENNNQDTFTKTYKVLNKTSFNEENSYYLTLQIFQGEVDTIIIKDLKTNIVENKTYEFVFEKNSTVKTEDNIKSIFNNYKLVEVKETDKVGLNQVQDKLN